MNERKHTILVAEDDTSLRKAIMDKLTLEGFAVIEAKNGEEVLQKALTNKPDLVLLDIFMPKRNGREVLKELKEKYGKELPIIMLTNAEPDDSMIHDIVAYQPAYYLRKSDTPLEEVVMQIKNVLE